MCSPRTAVSLYVRHNSRIAEYISLYSINRLASITRTECLLRGTDWVFKCNLGYMLYMDLRTNSDYFPIQNQPTGFYNQDGVCSLRGTDWVFKNNSG